jgi:hypothetical protein
VEATPNISSEGNKNLKNFGQERSRHLHCSGQERRYKVIVNRNSSIARRARCVHLHKFRIWRYQKTIFSKGKFLFSSN